MRLSARHRHILVSSVHCPGDRLYRPPPVIPVTGGKDPGGMNSTGVPIASPTARPTRQPRTLLWVESGTLVAAIFSFIYLDHACIGTPTHNYRRGYKRCGLPIHDQIDSCQCQKEIIMATNSSTSLQRLAGELKSLHQEPVEGFLVTLPAEEDLYTWHVAIFGPPDTPYQGGYFKAEMRFPQEYPYSPPRLKFLTPLLHPNVYSDGELCVSILHSPGEDMLSGELPQERWNPTQSVRCMKRSVLI
ncbi:PREDICTED: ubiquitin-conjugating enzyme E2 R2-like isoform X2 [Amphimedon queenslandica]|uniref:UBC core domain-containing protein n=1 Tax=Amphimedon queenslandica TaxID=400682 RepID=A0AAN0JXH6_AMPQE|nr:PREDICTED: ubiquitin-conjugating enzyme E2 R2-like isoform X2 [Amphimedon queenslandica]|eukprot:XP_019861650.1 PREDICTED: ubiquitin-conjugating enzyme E2 R2-like isoform X2 [Amphimedon queenslandica]